jgi:cell division protein FtsB
MALKRNSLSAPTTIVLVLLLLLLARGTFNVYQKWSFAGDAATSAQDEMLRLRLRKAELEAQIARLKSEEGIEAELREQYQVGKPGEEVITIVDTPNSSRSATSSVSVEENGFWARAKAWFR